MRTRRTLFTVLVVLALCASACSTTNATPQSTISMSGDAAPTTSDSPSPLIAATAGPVLPSETLHPSEDPKEFHIASSVRPELAQACRDLDVAEEILAAAGPITLTDLGDTSAAGVTCVFRPGKHSAGVREGDFIAIEIAPEGRETFRGLTAKDVPENSRFADEVYWMPGTPGVLIAFKGSAAITINAYFSVAEPPPSLNRMSIEAIAAKLASAVR